MTDTYTALGSALFSYLDNAATVNVYQDRGPQGGTPPYCVYQRQAATDEYVFGDTNGIVNADYVVRIVSNRTWAGEAELVYAHVHAALQHGTVSVSGHTRLRCERMSSIKYLDSENYWHVGGLYRVAVDPT